jgi:hypothetical protein
MIGLVMLVLFSLTIEILTCFLIIYVFFHPSQNLVSLSTRQVVIVHGF